jgi:hypothetical protein
MVSGVAGSGLLLAVMSQSKKKMTVVAVHYTRELQL